MTVEEALRQLGAAYGISLTFNGSHTTRLIYDGNTFVDFETTDPRSTVVVLHGLVGVVPLKNRAPMFQILLEANLFGRGTDGAVLSIDIEQGEVILHRALDVRATTFQEFREAVESFAVQVKSWTDQLARPVALDAAAIPIDETFVRSEASPHLHRRM